MQSAETPVHVSSKKLSRLNFFRQLFFPPLRSARNNICTFGEPLAPNALTFTLYWIITALGPLRLCKLLLYSAKVSRAILQSDFYLNHCLSNLLLIILLIF